jgi:hypothetical protein
MSGRYRGSPLRIMVLDIFRGIGKPLLIVAKTMACID